MYHFWQFRALFKNFLRSYGFELFSSLFLAFIYFLPAILGHYKNILIFADNGTLNVPAFMELGNQLRQGIFQGFDWVTHNGSSDFFLRSNLTIYNPLWMLVAYLSHPSSFNSAIDIMLGAYIFLAFSAMLTLQLIGKQFLAMDRWIALLFAVIYVFSKQTCNSLALQPFYFCMMLFPLLVYTCLVASITSSYSTLFLLSFWCFSFLFAGYCPLAVFGLLLSLLSTFFYIWHINPEKYPLKWQATIHTLTPAAIACLIAFPGYIAIMQFFSIASTGHHGLEFSAYGVTEHLAQSFSIISGVFASNTEHFLVFGTLPVLFLIYFFCSLSKQAPFFKEIYHLKRRIIYFGLVLIILESLICFGKDLHASTLFYYLFPGIGKMHSYQRYFIFCYLFFSAGVALIYEYILTNKNDGLIKKFIGLFLLLVLILAGLFYFPNSQNSAVIAVAPRLFVEILLAMFVFIACLLFSFRGAILTSIFAFIIIGIQYGYNLQIDFRLPTYILDKTHRDENSALIHFLKTQSNKQLIKYMNLSTIPYSYIPPNYPWIVHSKINLANYIGYEEHLSEDNGYRKHVRFYGDIDWEWLRQTGADYVIYDATTYKKYQSQIDTYTEPTIHFILSMGDIVAKLKQNFSLYPEGDWIKVEDNGYVILLFNEQKSMMDHFYANAQKVTFNLTVEGSHARLVLPIWANRHLQLIVNNKKTQFEKWQDHYYYDFKTGHYEVRILYKNTIQNLFLWLMAFYCCTILVVSLYRLTHRHERRKAARSP